MADTRRILLRLPTELVDLVDEEVSGLTPRLSRNAWIEQAIRAVLQIEDDPLRVLEVIARLEVRRAASHPDTRPEAKRIAQLVADAYNAGIREGDGEPAAR